MTAGNHHTNPTDANSALEEFHFVENILSWLWCTTNWIHYTLIMPKIFETTHQTQDSYKTVLAVPIVKFYLTSVFSVVMTCFRHRKLWWRWWWYLRLPIPPPAIGPRVSRVATGRGSSTTLFLFPLQNCFSILLIFRKYIWLQDHKCIPLYALLALCTHLVCLEQSWKEMKKWRFLAYRCIRFAEYVVAAKNLQQWSLCKFCPASRLPGDVRPHCWVV